MTGSSDSKLSFLRFGDAQKRGLFFYEAPFRVMLFSHQGTYPKGTIFCKNGFFHADKEIVFSLVRGESWRQLDNSIPYSEFDWASPQEMRLMASLVMCEKTGGPKVSLYPVVGPLLRIDASELEMTWDTVRQARALLLKGDHNQEESYYISKCRSQPHELIDAGLYSLDKQPAFWGRLDPRNYLILRGIYALIKVDMLSQHREFCEEAVIAAYIALEASYQLILRELNKEGNKTPNAHDAALWLHDAIYNSGGEPACDPSEKYFGDFYAQRIMTLHPYSRFGEFPYSPAIHDDFFHLRHALQRVFARLLQSD